MANVIGEGFREYVSSQIKTRQGTLGKDPRDNSNLVFANSNTGWIKATSAATGLSSNLSDLYVLFGGTYDNTQGILSGLESYSLGGLSQGYRPMPGIISMETKNRNRGSVRETTLEIKAFNQQQFRVIDLLFMRLGYSVLVEFGHSVYFTNDGTSIKASESSTLSKSLLAGEYDNNLKALQKAINEKKASSNGNYDAVFGRVTNFNWSFSKDATYDITVTLISYGDVVESLKLNVIADGSTGTVAAAPTAVSQSAEQLQSAETDAEVIEAVKNQNIFGELFYKLKTTLDNSPTTNKTAILNASSDFPSGDNTGPYYNYDACRIDEFNAFDNTEYYYIRLGALLQFIWDKRMIYLKDGDPLVAVDVDMDSNLMYATPYTLGADPRICLVKTAIDFGGSTYSLFSDLPEEVNFKGAYPNTGKVMNVYVSMGYILKKLDELKDESNKVVLIDFLTEVCNDISRTTGGVSKLAPIVDEEESRLYILDETSIPELEAVLEQLGKVKTSEPFRVYGFSPNAYGNFIRDFGIKTEISSELASTLTIGAQANGTAVGEDATAFSTWNAGLIDRVLGDKKIDKTATEDSEDINTKLTLLQQYADFVHNMSLYEWDEQVDSYPETLTNMITTWRQHQAKTANRSSNALGFIPINLNLEMLGLSGMKIYNKININSDFLPTNYGNALTFIIKGISHKVTTEGWVTSIESTSVPASVVAGENTVTTTITPSKPQAGTGTGKGTAASPGGAATPPKPGTSGNITYIADPNPNYRAKSIFGTSGKTKGLWSNLGGPVPHTERTIRTGMVNIWQNTNAWDLDVPAGTYVYAIDDMEIINLRNYGLNTNGSIYGNTFNAKLSDGTLVFYAHLQSVNQKAVVGGKLAAGEFVGIIAPTSNFDPHLHIALSSGDLFQKYLNTDKAAKAVTNPSGKIYDWINIGTLRKTPKTTLGPNQQEISYLSALAANLRNTLLNTYGEMKETKEKGLMDTATKNLVAELNGYITPGSSTYKNETQAKTWLDSNVFINNFSVKDAKYFYVAKRVVRDYKSPNTLDSERENNWETKLEEFITSNVGSNSLVLKNLGSIDL